MAKTTLPGDPRPNYRKHRGTTNMQRIINSQVGFFDPYDRKRKKERVAQYRSIRAAFGLSTS